MATRIFTKFSVYWIPWIFVAFVSISTLLPASYWFEVNDIKISDAVEGKIPTMFVRRRIHAEFTAEWVVTIRKKVDNGFHVVCVNSGVSNYKPRAVYPANLDLKWWTSSDDSGNNSCANQIARFPGDYIAVTTWRITRPSLQIAGFQLINSLTDKYVSNSSNIFRIKKEEP